MNLLNISQTLINKGLPILGNLIAGNKGEETIQKVLTFLGISESQLEEKLQDPTIITQLKELELKELELLLNDRANARNRQIMLNDKFVDILADKIIKYNMLFVFILVLINALLIIYAPKIKIPISVIAPVSNIFGIVIGRFLEERSQVTGYYFGSSIKGNHKDVGNEK